MQTVAASSDRLLDSPQAWEKCCRYAERASCLERGQRLHFALNLQQGHGRNLADRDGSARRVLIDSKGAAASNMIERAAVSMNSLMKNYYLSFIAVGCVAL